MWGAGNTFFGKQQILQPARESAVPHPSGEGGEGTGETWLAAKVSTARETGSGKDDHAPKCLSGSN